MNNLQKNLTVSDFFKANINCGTIKKIEDFPEARNPSYKIWVDFGKELGIKQTAAQLTRVYSKNDLLGKQILAVTNFSSKRIAGFKSEFLTLGLDSDEGVVILQPERKVENGTRVY
ncbi:MAG: Methionine--tRNA ligase [Candidatus Heimdallarchaeota archaeon LC_3]|nr:MAG: Methionine--tRNA ligase [Candidatus Heimdallarchaeota archaeon LC_3]